MTSLRSLTISLSFCFALTSSLADSVLAAECSLDSELSKESPELDFVLAKARKAAGDQDWESAESCIDKADAIAPLNREVAFLKARIKAFQGKHDEAKDLLEDWPAVDEESREIRGDLAWYRGDLKSAEKWYRSSIGPKASAASWKLWLKALKAKKDPQYPKALEAAKKRYPDDAELAQMNGDSNEIEAKPRPKTKTRKRKDSSKPDPDRSKYRAAVGVTQIEETQNQSARSYDADAAWIYHRKSLSLGITSISRDYGPTTATDTPLRMGLGIGYVSDEPDWIRSQETSLSFGGTVNPTFTPARFIGLRHEIFFSDMFSVSGEIGVKWYPTLFVRTENLGLHYRYSQFHYQTRIYLTQALHQDTALFLGIGYEAWPLVPEFYMVGGRDAASRPYLFRTDDETFLTVGLQLTYRFNPMWAIRGNLEERWESGYRQRSATVTLLWFDR